MKHMKKLATLLLTLLLCLCAFLTACGGSSSTLKSGDVFEFSSLSYVENGTQYTFSVGQMYEGVVLEKDTYVAIVAENNTIAVRQKSDDYSSGMLFTYTKGYEKNEYYLWTQGSYLYNRNEFYASFTYSKKQIVVHIYDEELTVTFTKA